MKQEKVINRWLKQREKTQLRNGIVVDCRKDVVAVQKKLWIIVEYNKKKGVNRCRLNVEKKRGFLIDSI